MDSYMYMYIYTSNRYTCTWLVCHISVGFCHTEDDGGSERGGGSHRRDVRVVHVLPVLNSNSMLSCASSYGQGRLS